MHPFFTLLVVLLALRLGAAEVSFTKDIAPVLVAKCLACHNPDKAKGGYRLHTFEALEQAGSSKEPILVPGQPEKSLLWRLITAKDEADRMPQKDEPLAPTQIAVIKRWIEQGANFEGGRTTPLAILSPPQFPTAPQTYPVTVPITALAFDAAGGRLATSGYYEIIFWDSRSGALTQRLGNVAERTFDLAFSPDGRWLAAASGTPGKIGEVKLFNATNGSLVRVLATLTDAALCLAFSADGKKLAAGGADNAIRLWNVESNQPPMVIEQHADWVLALAFSPDCARLVSGSRDKSARVFDGTTGELEETYTGHSEFVTGVTWADNSSVVSASRAKSAHRWKVDNAKKSEDFSGWNGEVTRVIVQDGNLYSASLDGKIREHKLESKDLTRTFEGHHDAIYALAAHAETKRLASSSHDGEVRVWNREDGTLLLKFLAAPGYTRKLSRTE